MCKINVSFIIININVYDQDVAEKLSAQPKDKNADVWAGFVK